MLTELKNRGVQDVLMLVCDGLKGLPDAVASVWPRTIVQTCIVHLLRNSFRYAARQDWAKIAAALKPVYTAATEDAATERFMEFADAWGRKYPAIVKLWSDAYPVQLAGRWPNSAAPIGSRPHRMQAARR